MGGHRRLQLSSTKNYERKKRQKLSFLVSLPLQLYVETPVTTLEQLCCKLEQLALPQGICIACLSFGLYLYILICTDWKCELREGVLNIIKLGYKGTCMEVIRCVAIRPDFSWSVYVCGVMVNQKLCTILMDLTETMHSGILHSYFNCL